MSEQSTDPLVEAREAAGLSQSELWMRYFALGGMNAAVETDAVVHGALETTAYDRDLLVHALNERFTELGGDHPVPYSDGAA